MLRVTFPHRILLIASGFFGCCRCFFSCNNPQIPHSLFRENGYDHREALFGMPSYGGSIAQNVYYSKSTLCDSNVDTSGGVPTRDIDPKTGKMKPWPSPYILMVDRGDCTFVQKVRDEFPEFRIGNGGFVASGVLVLLLACAGKYRRRLARGLERLLEPNTVDRLL